MKELIARYPWLARFVGPVVALVTATGILSEADADILIQALVGIAAGVSAIWGFVEAQRRTVPVERKPVKLDDGTEAYVAVRPHGGRETLKAA